MLKERLKSMNELKKYSNEQRFPSIWDLIDKIDSGFMPLDTVFDKMFTRQFPSVAKEMGITRPFGSQGYPKINVAETDKQYEITAELAGMSKKDVSVELDSETNVLTISGNKTEKEEKSEEKKYIIRELKQSSFSRSIIIGDNCDKNSCKADFDNGILKITIDKKVEDKPKNTKIKVM